MEDALFEFKVSRTYQGAIEGRGIKNPADLMAFFYERVYRKIDAWQRENCVAVYLDAGNHILGWELLSIGTSCSCLVDIKGIIRSVCLTGAASVALAHNHPSLGDCKPSKADIEEVSRIQTILKSAGIILLDFVILTQNGFGYTFSEERVIKCEISPENGQETQQPKGWSEDERIRKELLEEIEFIIPHDDETDGEGLTLPSYHARIDKYKSYLERQKEQKPAKDTALQEAFINSKIDYTLEEKCDASDYAEIILPTSVIYGENEEEYKLHKIIEAAFIAGQKKEQNPEWSEEDKHYIHQLILFCENCMQQDSEAIRCATWLKSLRPQPHWKPSDEQMKALKAIVCGDSTMYYMKWLRALYNDLKKL